MLVTDRWWTRLVISQQVQVESAKGKGWTFNITEVTGGTHEPIGGPNWGHHMMDSKLKQEDKVERRADRKDR